MAHKRLYEHICKKYPEVVYVEGENLSMENMYAQEVKKMWVNVSKYPTVLDIASKLRISDHTIYRLAKEYNMGSRRDYHKTNYIIL